VPEERGKKMKRKFAIVSSALTAILFSSFCFAVRASEAGHPLLDDFEKANLPVIVWFHFLLKLVEEMSETCPQPAWLPM
jgi:hypothetical protein